MHVAYIWIIVLIVYIFLGLFLYAFTKSVRRTLFYLALILVVVTSIVGVFMFLDALKFKQHFASDEKLFLLEENGKLLTGFSGTLFDESTDITFLTEESLNNFQTYYSNQEYEKILGNKYKVFIFKLDIFSNVSYLETDYGTFDREFIFGLLRTVNPLDMFLEETQGTSNLPRDAKNNMLDAFNGQIGLKGLFFGGLFATAIQEEGVMFIIREFQPGNIIIYPETVMFKFLKILPYAIIKDIVDKAEKIEPTQ